MKKLLLPLLLSSMTVHAQQTITSIANGNASNFLIWDCTCIPTPDDDIIINTNVTLDVNWLVNAGGSVTVTPTGNLIKSGVRSMLIDGSGSGYFNLGTTSLDGLAFTNGATGTNSGTFSIDQGMYTGPGTSFTNSGLLNGLDSLMTEGSFTSNGTIYTGNFLNTGTFDNTGTIAADSVGNTGTFTSAVGYMTFNAFGNTGTVNLSTSGWMEVAQNFLNAGIFTQGAGHQLYAGADFFNADTLGGIADLTNDGMIEVVNNFYNTGILDGAGDICIGVDSYNGGAVSGTLDICDNTGTDFDLNLGTVAMSVTFCQPGCYVGLEESGLQLEVFPNPSNECLSLNVWADQYSVLTIEGKTVAQGIGDKIETSELSNGSYLLRINSGTNSDFIRFEVQH